MDAQRVEILHVTHGDTVVVAVTHYLVFYFLPAFQRFLHQHLWREGKGLFGEFIQFVLIVTEARAKSAQSVGSTQDDRIAQVGSSLAGIFNIITGLTLDGLHANLVELFHEELAVFSIHDSLHRSTQHLHVVFLQYTTLIQLNTTVQCRLSTEGQQDAVWMFLGNNLLYEIWLYRQEIDFVGNALRRLDCGNIRIDEHSLDAFLAKRFQSL